MSIAYTQARLIEWGKWGRERGPSWPRASCLWNVSSGHIPEMPQRVVQVDGIITRMQVDTEERPHRRVLIAHYLNHGTIREHAERLGIAKSTYHDRLERAQWAVHVKLEVLDDPDRCGMFGPNISFCL
jgi:hypothetical protein